jgi:hypothetical protein
LTIFFTKYSCYTKPLVELEFQLVHKLVQLVVVLQSTLVEQLVRLITPLESSYPKSNNSFSNRQYEFQLRLPKMRTF